MDINVSSGTTNPKIVFQKRVNRMVAIFDNEDD